jgi:glycosyltransferase involved in cell wall biosynthesis
MRHPLRTLWILPSLEGGGAERAIATILSHLDPDRVQAHLLLHHRKGAFLDEIPTHIPIDVLSPYHRLDPRLIRQLAGYLQTQRYDVVIAVLRYWGLLAAVAHRWAGRPGKLLINEQNLPSREMQLYGGYWFKREMIRWAYHQASGVVTISEAIRQDLISNFGLDEASIRVIGNPVDTTHIRIKAKGPSPHPWFNGEEPVIVSVGRLHPQKGHDILLRAFARLRERMATRLIIVGEGPQRDQLIGMAKALDIAEYTDFVGFHPNPYRYMQAAVAFTLASRYEGFGVVLAEAMALGLPIVATDCPGGPREVLADGEAGLLVPPGDSIALADALARVISDVDLQRKLGDRAQIEAQRFRGDHIAEAYTDLLAEMTGL